VWTSDVGGNQTIFSNDRLGWNDDVLFGLSPDAGSTAATRWGVTHHDNDTQLRTMVESPVAAEPYQWYHVAASSDGDLLRLYVNGELVGESPAAGADLSFDGALARAGRSFNPNENGRPFYGEISELAVFDHALSDEDLEIQYLTGANLSPPPLPPQEPRHGVSVAHVHVTGTDNASTVATVLRQSPGDTIEAGQNSAPNIGDITLTSGPSEQQFYQSTGVLIANASTLAIPGSHVNPRAFIEAPGELTNFESFSNGRGVWMSLTDISGSGSEANFDFTFAYFPFADGWVGGHVSGAGTIVGGNAESVTVVNTGMGQHLLSIDGVNSLQDGMLFTIGARNGTSGNTVVTGPTTGGSGWEIRVEDQGSDFPTPESSNGEAEPFSFVYVPLDADNLIGGRVSTGGTRYFWAGDFQLTSLAPHQALITIPGKTDEDGILLLTVNEIESKDGVFGPDDIFLVYEYSDALGGFIVDARDLTGASAEANAIFSFAFVEFDNPLRLSGAPGDANFDGAVDRRDLVVLARNYGRVGTALHSDGDFDVNWNVELKDLAILQRDWGVAVGNSPVATVPEPSAGLMAIVSLGFLSAVSRRRR
jgi:hypothetical protein